MLVCVLCLCLEGETEGECGEGGSRVEQAGMGWEGELIEIAKRYTLVYKHNVRCY